MPQHTWVYDAPTGTYKNHAMSSQLLEGAIAEAVVAPYAQTVQGFGKKMGESITLTRVSAITEPTSPVLSETQRIPEDALALSTKSITAQEIGRAVPITSLSNDLSEYDIMNQTQRQLRRQMTLALDTLAGVALRSTLLKYAPTGLTTSNVTTNGTFGAAATANMNVYHAEQIRDTLYDTYLVPPYEGDDYIGIFRTLGIRGIKNDPAWEEWHKYTDPSAKFNSEVGRMENIRFIETNHNGALRVRGTGSVLGEGVVFGEDGLALAEVMTPEIRVATPEDFGRSQAAAWYGILKYDLFWDTANAGEVRVLHVGST